MYFPKQTLGGFTMPKSDEGNDGLGAAQKEMINTRSKEFHNRRNSMEKLVYSTTDPVAQGDSPSSLLFSSEFESGNLERSYQIATHEYDLELASDANARGSTQWFNFSVTNAHPATYTFNIVNFVKPSSLYNKGLRPCFYSRKLKKWTSVGNKVCYFRSRLPKRERNNQTCDLYAMSFTLDLNDPKDVYYLAYCYPFTYTDLQIYLRSLEEASKRQSFYKFKRDALCTTVQGRRCDIIKISKKTKKTKTSGAADKTEKKYIVVSGRVHPGETNASWVVKGMLDFLTSNKVWSIDLLEQYRFVFIPMLNPDGVAIGNYRCDTNGYDLNRCWKSPNEVLHPTIYHVKNYIRKLLSKGEVSLFFDIHGHSRKQNVFAYGNSNARRYRLKSAPKYPHSEKILPLMMSKLCSEFAYDECTFHITKKKEGTARVVNWAELGIPLSYTIEASFLGSSSVGDGNYTIVQYQELGMMLLRAVHEYINPNQAFVQSVVAELCAMQSGRDSGDMPRCIDTYGISSYASRTDRRQSEAQETENDDDRKKSVTPHPQAHDGAHGHSSCLRPSSAKGLTDQEETWQLEAEEREALSDAGEEADYIAIAEEVKAFIDEMETASNVSHENECSEFCEEEEEIEESESSEGELGASDLNAIADPVAVADAAAAEEEAVELDTGYHEDNDVDERAEFESKAARAKEDLHAALQRAVDLDDELLKSIYEEERKALPEGDEDVAEAYSFTSDLAPLSSPSVGASVPVSTLFPNTAIVSRDFLGERARHSAEADIDPDESTDSDSSSTAAEEKATGEATAGKEQEVEKKVEKATEIQLEDEEIQPPIVHMEVENDTRPEEEEEEEEEEDVETDDEGDAGIAGSDAPVVDEKKVVSRQPSKKKAKRKKKKNLQPMVPRSGLVSSLQQRISNGRVFPLPDNEGRTPLRRGDSGRRERPSRQLALENVAVGSLRHTSRRYSSTGSLRAAALPHPPIRLRAGSLGISNVLRTQVRPNSSSRPKRSTLGQTPAPPAAPVAASQTTKPIRGNMAISRRRS
eukprot:TRINITY_DN15327_c0_g1_i4.p1 TRINITY_DN15327_c0_g1~~TRINITY_DN15327_c0_g1_i4.p1  ORF type:complete len:1033 (+),score=252.67 TRINITY_DN15327_c0_g1_i4:54-3152(+)